MKSNEYKKAINFWNKKEVKKMPAELLKAAVEEFFFNNAVCALATGAGSYVRCTPLEYSYHDGKFWIFTEGGEKFIGLGVNKNVSLAVFDKNPNFGELKGVQVMGVAELIEPAFSIAFSASFPASAINMNDSEPWSIYDALTCL